jgi:hypothetical protein
VCCTGWWAIDLQRRILELQTTVRPAPTRDFSFRFCRCGIRFLPAKLSLHLFRLSDSFAPGALEKKATRSLAWYPNQSLEVVPFTSMHRCAEFPSEERLNIDFIPAFGQGKDGSPATRKLHTQFGLAFMSGWPRALSPVGFRFVTKRLVSDLLSLSSLNSRVLVDHFMNFNEILFFQIRISSFEPLSLLLT